MITLWCNEGHTSGSFGSSLGCGTRMIGTVPFLSYFNFESTCAVRLSSSNTKEVPRDCKMKASVDPEQGRSTGNMFRPRGFQDPKGHDD